MVQYFTRKGLQKLKDELHDLKTKKTKEIADLLKYAASFGDLKENAGYDDAKERQSWLLRRIAELESIVNNAIVKEKEGTDKVQIGSKIKILFDGKEENYEIVAPGESDILNNRLSYESPLGKNLMAKESGNEFDFQSGAKKVKIKIISIN